MSAQRECSPARNPKGTYIEIHVICQPSIYYALIKFGKQCFYSFGQKSHIVSGEFAFYIVK